MSQDFNILLCVLCSFAMLVKMEAAENLRTNSKRADVEMRY